MHDWVLRHEEARLRVEAHGADEKQGSIEFLCGFDDTGRHLTDADDTAGVDAFGLQLFDGGVDLLLRFLGWDAFVLSESVLMCLRDSGVTIGSGTSKKDLKAAQAQFNAWREESGLPITHISRTCAMSIGENYPVQRLKEIMQL